MARYCTGLGVGEKTTLSLQTSVTSAFTCKTKLMSWYCSVLGVGGWEKRKLSRPGDECFHLHNETHVLLAKIGPITCLDVDITNSLPGNATQICH